jgi:hypothetical protein
MESKTQCMVLDVDAAVRLTEEHVLGTYRADTSP